MLKNYRERRAVLAQLGFETYADYLRSPLWSIIRKVVFRRDNYRCRSPHCRGNKAKHLEAHHLDYSLEVLLGMNCGAIVTLCDRCHAYCEFTDKAKLPLARVRTKTLRRIGCNTRGKLGYTKVKRWIRAQLPANKAPAGRIVLLLKNEAPAYYAKLVQAAKSVELRRTYLNYLGLRQEP